MEDNWFPWKNVVKLESNSTRTKKKKSVRILPPDFKRDRETLYKKDIFTLDYMSLLRPEIKSDPVTDVMKRWNSIKRANRRKIKIKKILG